MSKENSGRDSPIGQEAGDASNAKVSPVDQGIGDSSKVKAAGDSEGSVDKIDSDTGNESEKEGTENGAVKNDDANTADGEGGENAEEDGITDSEIDAGTVRLRIRSRKDLSHLMEKPTMWFPNRFDTNQAVQSQKMARSLKFWILVEEELCYPSSKNKGADQLRSHCEADLRLCFRLCRLLVFPCGGSYFKL